MSDTTETLSRPEQVVPEGAATADGKAPIGRDGRPVKKGVGIERLFDNHKLPGYRQEPSTGEKQGTNTRSTRPMRPEDKDF